MVDHGPPSRFAFLMHADVVGSTALVQRDERLAHEHIQAAFRRLSQCIRDYGGTTHELRGDALVAEFEKASEAVSAALAFQGDRHAAGGEDAPRLRIGIAMGEVIVADGTVTGAAAVLAQRLEQLAEGGDVVVQGAACESIPQRLPFTFTSLGEHEVKGFAQPVRAFTASMTDGAAVPPPVRANPLARLALPRFTVSRRALLAVGIAAAIGAVAAWQPWQGTPSVGNGVADGELPDRPSIAVLPLGTAGGEEQSVLAEGLSLHLATTLARLPGLFVTAPASAFTYKGTSIGDGEVAEALGVRHLARGRLSRNGDELSLHLRVIDAVSGTERLDHENKGSWASVFTLRDRLLRDMAKALDIDTRGEAGERLLAGDTDDPVAFDFFLRGQALAFRLNPEDNARAREMFLRATDRDAGFALATAALAMTYVNDARFGWNDAGGATVSLAREMTDKALASEQRFAAPHLAAAHVALLAGNAADALAAADRAIALDASAADAHGIAAEALTRTARPEAAVERLAQALRLNPFPPPWYESLRGRTHYFAGNLDEAREHLQRAVELDPNDLTSRILLSAVMAELDEGEAARRQAAQVQTLLPGFDRDKWLARSPYAGAARVGALKTALREAGFVTRERRGFPSLELPPDDTGRK